MDTRNEAAERLRQRFGWGEDRNTLVRLLGQSLAAERRATVERIRDNPALALDRRQRAILDEEAAASGEKP
jgi:hypothetical protein